MGVATHWKNTPAILPFLLTDKFLEVESGTGQQLTVKSCVCRLCSTETQDIGFKLPTPRVGNGLCNWTRQTRTASGFNRTKRHRSCTTRYR
jgi:hypothetical protein